MRCLVDADSVFVCMVEQHRLELAEEPQASREALSQELDLLALEPQLYGLTPDPLDILQDHTSVNINRTASQCK